MILKRIDRNVSIKERPIRKIYKMIKVGRDRVYFSIGNREKIRVEGFGVVKDNF